MERFVSEKRGLGFRYRAEALALMALDRHLHASGLTKPELPRKMVEAWLAVQPHQRPKTHANRRNLIAQLSRYLIRNGISAYLPEKDDGRKVFKDYVPYIFSHEEIGKLLTAIDLSAAHALSPRRHLVIPAVFRLLICTGMRVGEVVALRRCDVDLKTGVLTLLAAKFGKDRLIPLTDDTIQMLREYVKTLPAGGPEDHFFSTGYGRPLSNEVVYVNFRKALSSAGIAHLGRGRGPRVHDLRHTFAVRRLETWYRRGEDLNIKLPLLSVYLGHLNLMSTQLYLRLTPSLYPDIVASLERTVGVILPGGTP